MVLVAVFDIALSVNLSSSKAAALRTEYKAGDTALSGAAHTQREAISASLAAAITSLSLIDPPG